MAYTSIQIFPETRKKIAKLKTSERETYDEVLNKLMDLVPARDEEGEYTDAFRVGLLNAKRDLRTGNIVSHEQLKKRLGM